MLRVTLLGILLGITAGSPLLAQEFSFDFSPEEVQKQLTICDRFGVDEVNANECYYQLAQNTGDPSICSRITNTARATSCQQNIVFKEEFSIRWLTTQSVLPLFLLIYIIMMAFNPPRSPFFMGGVIGAGMVGTLYLVSQSEAGLAQVIAAHKDILVRPTDGLLIYAPRSFTALNEWIQLMIAHVVLYGSVCGFMLQGRRENYMRAIFIFGIALFIAHLSHPGMTEFAEWVRSFIPAYQS